MSAVHDVRVLLVHHDTERCVRIACGLRRWGWTCVAFTEGIDAARALRTRSFHVLVIDDRRPGRDDDAAMEELRRRGDVPQIRLAPDDFEGREMHQSARRTSPGRICPPRVNALREAILTAVGTVGSGAEFVRSNLVGHDAGPDGAATRSNRRSAGVPRVEATASGLSSGDVVVSPEAAGGVPTPRQLDRASPAEIVRWMEASRRQVSRSYVESVLTLVEAVEAKEPGALGHARHVSRYGEMIARRLSFSPQRIEAIRTAALLHDVGKIGVPDAILRKPGPLDDAEYAVIKEHPRTALRILVHASFLTEELQWILHHHERYDGRGYPDGLIGEAIPVGARVLAVADAIDAMRADRDYRPGSDIERIRQELRRCAGTQFDPVVVIAALDRVVNEKDLEIETGGDSPSPVPVPTSAV